MLYRNEKIGGYHRSIYYGGLIQGRYIYYFLLVTVANNGNDINIDFRYFLMKHMEKSLKIIHFTKKIAFLSIKLTYLHICEGV